jgi:hypothetical protein
MDRGHTDPFGGVEIRTEIFPPLFNISTVQALDIFGESLVTTVCVRVMQSE